MKIYYLYPEIRVPDDLSLVVIIYHCLSNIWAVFEPQLCKALIINTFNILHRKVLHRRWSQMKLSTVGIVTDSAQLN